MNSKHGKMKQRVKKVNVGFLVLLMIFSMILPTLSAAAAVTNEVPDAPTAIEEESNGVPGQEPEDGEVDIPTLPSPEDGEVEVPEPPALEEEDLPELPEIAEIENDELLAPKPGASIQAEIVHEQHSIELAPGESILVKVDAAKCIEIKCKGNRTWYTTLHMTSIGGQLNYSYNSIGTMSDRRKDGGEELIENGQHDVDEYWSHNDLGNGGMVGRINRTQPTFLYRHFEVLTITNDSGSAMRVEWEDGENYGYLTDTELRLGYVDSKIGVIKSEIPAFTQQVIKPGDVYTVERAEGYGDKPNSFEYKHNGVNTVVSYRLGSELIASQNAKYDVMIDTLNTTTSGKYGIPPLITPDMQKVLPYKDFRYQFDWNNYNKVYKWSIHYTDENTAIRIKVRNTGQEDITFLAPYSSVIVEKDETNTFGYEEIYLKPAEKVVFKWINSAENHWVKLTAIGEKQGDTNVIYSYMSIPSMTDNVTNIAHIANLKIAPQKNNGVINVSDHNIRVVYPVGVLKPAIQNNFTTNDVIKRKVTISGGVPSYGNPGATAPKYLTVSGDQSSLVSDPIDTATGAFTTTQNIMGLPIHYYSLMQSNGTMGTGWEHPYDIKVNRLSSILTIKWSENRETIYRVVGTAGRSNIYKGINKENELDIVEVIGATTTLTQQDGTQYVFENNLIQKIKTRTGQETEIIRDATKRISEIKDSQTNQSIHLSYNTSNKIVKVTDNAGRAASITYGGSWRLTEIKGANGYKTTYTYDSKGLILSSSDNEGKKLYENTYDERWRVIQQENNGTTYFDYTYDQENSHQITEVTDRNGNKKKLTHENTTMKLIKVEDELGNITTSSYNVDGTVSTDTDENGNTTSYNYDDVKNLTSIVDAQGNKTEFEYDSKNNIVKATNAGSVRGTYTYDDNNLLVTETDAKGNTTSYTYTEDNQLKEVRLPDGGTTKYTYEEGNLKTVTDPTGVTTTYESDETGRILATIDSEGNRTGLVYDGNGNLLKVKDALNNETTYEYDTRNRLINETDSKGNATAYDYDTNNNLKSTTDALGNKTTYTYDLEDNLQKVTDRLGNTTEFTRDSTGRLASVIDPLGNEYGYDYDNAGNTVSETDAYGVKVQKYEYDTLHNPIKITDSLGNQTLISYNQWSDVTKTVNALNQTQEYSYYDIGMVGGVTDALGSKTAQDYNNMGQATSITDVNGNKTTFSYDLSGRMTKLQLENGSAINYIYNDHGQLAKTTNSRGQEFTFAYDKLGRVVKTVKTEGTIKVTYDENGNVLTSTDESGTLTYTYDKLNRLTTYTDSYGNIIGYKYDDNGNLLELKYPDGKEVTYTYDKAGNLKTVTDWKTRRTTYDYDKNGRLVKTTRPNGTVESRTYDTQGQLLSKTDVAPGGKVIHEDLYTYNGVGNITTEQTEAKGVGTSKNYQYDALNRVTSATRATGAEQYTYDKQGNILTATTGDTAALTMTYGANNRLMTVNNAAIGYDQDGNAIQTVLNGKKVNLQYDSMNRLKQAGSTKYKYDVNNNRVGLVEDGVDTRFIVNPNAAYSQLLMETDSAGKPLKYYVYGLGLIAEESADSDYKVYHYDLRGSTVALTDAVGKTTDTFEYGTYGELITTEGTAVTRFLYNGRDGVQTDSNGLYQMRARYYNPEIKRFINQDVLLGGIGDSTSLNRYSYVNGNPVSYIDPFGLEAQGTNYLGVTKEILSYVPFVGNVISIYDAAKSFSKGNIAEGIMYSVFVIPGLGNVAKAGKGATKLGKYSVGPYNKLKSQITGLDAHHAGQQAGMKRLIKGYDARTAPTILVPQKGHTRRMEDGTKILARDWKWATDPRQLLARDIRELRRVYPDIPNSKLKELIDMNKQMYPEMRR